MVLDDKYTWSGYVRWLKELSEVPVSGKVERLEGMMIHIFMTILVLCSQHYFLFFLSINSHSIYL